MSRDENKELTTEDKLAKMERILAGHKKHRKVLGRQLKRAQARLSGAKKEANKAKDNGASLKEINQKDTLVRRFTFDVEQLTEKYSDVTGKETWAKRLIESLQGKVVTSKEGDLIHKPFAKLKFKIG